MLVLLSCAKLMNTQLPSDIPRIVTKPRYQKEANRIAMAMTQYSVDQLEKELNINQEIAIENYRRYQSFHSPDSLKLPALLSYSGIVFQQLATNSFSPEDWEYTQDHLRLTSFCYGILRPLDLIHAYRLEGRIKIPELEGKSLYSFWKERLTDQFIEDIHAAGGMLCNLASTEMKKMFDWKRIEREVKVITPSFQVLKEGRKKTIVVYTKMCRGAMTRFILQNKLEKEEELHGFNWEDFAFDEDSVPSNPSFLLY
ncbi:MAG: YaaA family protein [Bacteroidales bacterium]|nr:YaaA family protein [Bacteroidales bacterium]